jgi:hypothetical protein
MFSFQSSRKIENNLILAVKEMAVSYLHAQMSQEYVSC